MAKLAEMIGLCHKPGVYFDMPEEEYHKDPSLGSTDVRALRNPRRYQLSSWMTNWAFKFESEATVVGTALHKIVLEGNKAFLETYKCRPPEYDKATQGEKTKITKEINASLQPGQQLLPSKDYRLCLEASDIITSNDDLRNSLVGGENEVSIFWIDQTGVPCKGRFDRLKPRGIGDIKTMANEKNRPIEVASWADFKTYRYDIQTAHYLIGASHIGALLKSGSIIGAGASRRILLEQVVSNIKVGDFGFQFIFLQKSAPDVCSFIISPENSMLRDAEVDRLNRIDAFKSMYERHGNNRWPSVVKVRELHREDLGEYGWY